MKITQLGFAHIVTILIILAVLAGGGWYAWQKYQGTSSKYQVTESPSPSASPSPTDEWQTFNSKYFNVSFQYPKGYEVYDSQNYIAVSNGEYSALEGADNAFFHITRFSYMGSSRASEISRLSAIPGVVKTNVKVDGSTFPAFEWDSGSIPNGKFKVIVFEVSHLEIIQYPRKNHPNGIEIGNQILSTLKFSSTANWKTYTNTEYGFELRYPQSYSVQARARFVAVGDFNQYCEGSGCSLSIVVPDENFSSVKKRIEENYQGIVSQKTISFAGVSGVEEFILISDFGGDKYKELLIPKDGKVFVIDLASGDSNWAKLQDQILSTFKFIP